MRAFISGFLIKRNMRVCLTEGAKKDTMKIQEILHSIELSVLVVPFDNTCTIINIHYINPIIFAWLGQGIHFSSNNEVQI